MKNFYFTLILSSLFAYSAQAQCNQPDLGALEGIVIERYYTSDENDATDSDGGNLPAGSVTWRIYADLKPEYRVLSVFGSPNNEMKIEIQNSYEFFNNEDRGDIVGNAIMANRLNDNTVALDSYITVGAASNMHWGVLKSLDPDGSFIGGSNNDGGSAGVANGLLYNTNPLDGVAVTLADGLLEGTVPEVTLVPGAADFEMFDNVNSPNSLVTQNAAYAVLGGTAGPTADNHVLLAQLTSNGVISGCINIQIGIPTELIGNGFNCKSEIRYFATLTPEDEALGNGNTVVWAAGTVSELCFMLDATSSVRDAARLPKFDLYPNPTNETFYINMFDNATEMRYEIVDTYGHVVKQKNIGATAEGMNIEIPVSDLPAGLYLVRVYSNGIASVKKLIKN
jgi:hypothetical protein